MRRAVEVLGLSVTALAGFFIGSVLGATALNLAGLAR